MFVIGGRGKDYIAVNSMERYDIDANLNWQPLKSMPRGRFGHVSWSHDSMIFVMGGISRHNGAVISTIDIFDINTGAWIECKVI